MPCTKPAATASFSHNKFRLRDDDELGCDPSIQVSLCCEREVKGGVRAEVNTTQRHREREGDLTAARIRSNGIH
jgi:hypothetical protein